MKTILKWVIGVLVFLIFCGIGIAFVLTKPKQNIYITSVPVTTYVPITTTVTKTQPEISTSTVTKTATELAL